MNPHGAPGPGHRFDLFGGPTLWDASNGVVRLSPTQEALLVLIWGHADRGITRAQTIWLLWEDEDSALSRQRLRQLLHELAARVGFRPVQMEGEDVLRPNLKVLSSDLDEYQAALQTGQLRRALSLVEAGFASRLRRLPGEEFEDWLEAKRAGLSRSLHEAAAAKWDQQAGVGAWDAARDAAEVLFALDQSETSLRRLLEARAATGHVGSAEAAFADFSRRLEPGEELSPETLTLMDRIRRLSGRRARVQAGSPDQPPLVGRQAHLEAAMRMVEGIRGNQFGFLAIRGDAGVGKTRLFDEIMREAHLKGFRCLDARPVELERRIPLNPLVDMVGRPEVHPFIVTMDDPWRAVVASLLPTLPDGMDPPVVPFVVESSLSRRLYDAFTLLLSNIAADRPTLLFIDDLQWADATTVAVLQFAQRRWRRGALGVIATIRPDLVQADDAVANYLNQSRDLPVTSLELHDLSEEEATTLVDLVAQGAIDPATCSQISALGGRNPFYLIELARDYMAGRVTLPALPSDTLVVPISLRQLVEPRLEGLSDRASAAASHLAVWGRAAPLEGLAALLSLSLDDCIRAVEELERSRLVTVERATVRIAHQLFRGAIYHGLSNSRRTLLHRCIAEHLTTTEQPLAGELAIHFSQAGRCPEAARSARQAADKALENGAVPETAFFLQLVIDNESQDELKAEATGDLARVLHKNREIARANPLLELAATRLRAVGNRARALKMDVRRVEGLAEMGAAPMSELLDRLASIKAAARSGNDDEALALALDAELHLLHRSGKVAEIRKLFEEVRVPAASENPVAACIANSSLAMNVLFGDTKEALRHGLKAVRHAAGQDGDHALRARIRLYVVYLYTGCAKSPEANAILSVAAEAAKTSGDVVLRFQVESNRGVAHLDAGELEDAEASFGRAGAILKGAEASLSRLNHHYNLGELRYQQGNYDLALAEFRTAEALIGGATTPTDMAQLINAGIGMSALELGLIAEARARETRQSPFPDSWYFDPTLVLMFASRLLERRSRNSDSYDLLMRESARVRDRFPPSWLKLLPLVARAARRAAVEIPVPLLREGLTVAREMGYSVRVLELQSLLERYERAGA